MTSLAQLQHDFIARCLSRSADIPKAITAKNMPMAHARMDIYADNVHHIAITSLASTYQAVSSLVGEEFFTMMATSYFSHHPPVSGCLYDYGGSFASFIKTFPPAQPLLYLYDVAAYEWAWHSSYIAGQDTPVSVTHSHHHYHLRNNVQLLHCTYDADAIWQFCIKDSITPDIALSDHYYVVHRPELDVSCLHITKEIFQILSHFRQGSTLANAIDDKTQADRSFHLSAIQKTLMTLQLLTT